MNKLKGSNHFGLLVYLMIFDKTNKSRGEMKYEFIIFS